MQTLFLCLIFHIFLENLYGKNDDRIGSERGGKIVKMKHFMDIPRIKEETDELSVKNTEAFEAGNHVVIQEKIDGANASIRYNADTGKLSAFSRNQEVFDNKSLKGFWSYVQTLSVEKFVGTEAYVIFGEWLIPHAVEYRPEAYNKWYVYDIYDMEKQEYLAQTVVREFCINHDLNYVKTFYDGPFISWKHCRGFVGQSEIALERGEGIVVKNQTKSRREDKRNPFMIKIVCDDFAEVRKRKKRTEDPEKCDALKKAQAITEQIVTARRVEKEWMKMRDEGLIANLEVKPNMQILAKNLPVRVYQDCMKEEEEMVMSCGEYFGKLCQKKVMKLIREIEESHK